MPYSMFLLEIKLIVPCLMLNNKTAKFIKSFNLQWCWTRDLHASQIPVTTGGFEL